MPKRPGQWELLDQDGDPVTADTFAVEARASQYRKFAQVLELEAATLEKIAGGDVLKGQYADALRESAREVSEDLHKVVGRYQHVVDAVTGFLPAIEIGLQGSADALDDAVEADGRGRAASAVPDIIAPEDGTLSAEDEAANTENSRRQDISVEDLLAAKAKLGSVLAELNAAGSRAAKTIRAGFDDGLTDTTGDRIKAWFVKFLQILTQVLMVIGMALAVIALLIPGLGAAVLMAIAGIELALVAVEVAAQAALLGLGGGSLADLGFAIAGLLIGGGVMLLMVRSAAKAAANAAKAARATPDGAPVPDFPRRFGPDTEMTDAPPLRLDSPPLRLDSPPLRRDPDTVMPDAPPILHPVLQAIWNNSRAVGTNGRHFMDPVKDAGHIAGAAKMDLSPNSYNVFVHGSSDLVHIGNWNLSASHLATLIRMDPAAKNFSHITLISCNTGTRGGGFATQFANHMDTVVVAPKGSPFVRSDGATHIIHPFVPDSWYIAKDFDFVSSKFPAGSWRTHLPQSWSVSS
ncbi:hypothetical protein [Cryobacterium sp. SO1]|uniref:hypothetical protein n=1 Tax=Cryobacterium sp. SO1 TaxID=1897061 RepID=UPI001022E750|nr:hypothetical protein [Cryobacterium sp. SO1]